MAKKIFTITPYCYNELINRGFDLNALYLLSLLCDGYDVSAFNNGKIAAYQQLLVRRDLITENMELTQSGTELLEFCSTTSKKLSLKKLNSDDNFQTWWSKYPASNCFTYNGKLFPGTQTKRQKQDQCRILFSKLINSGYKGEDIIGATEFHINMAKSESFKKKENQVSYIYNSERYLREKSFEPYISMYKTPLKQETTSNNKSVVDI